MSPPRAALARTNGPLILQVMEPMGLRRIMTLILGFKNIIEFKSVFSLPIGGRQSFAIRNFDQNNLKFVILGCGPPACYIYESQKYSTRFLA